MSQVQSSYAWRSDTKVFIFYDKKSVTIYIAAYMKTPISPYKSKVHFEL